MELNQIDKKLLDLVEKIIKISEDTLKNSKQMPPTLLSLGVDGKESLDRFVEGEMDDLKVKAQEHIKTHANLIEYCVLSYDGRVTNGSDKTDSIIVVGYSKQAKNAYIFAEKYSKDGNETRFDKEISFIDQDKNLLKNLV